MYELEDTALTAVGDEEDAAYYTDAEELEELECEILEGAEGWLATVAKG
jgi:hypothetical protein